MPVYGKQFNRHYNRDFRSIIADLSFVNEDDDYRLYCLNAPTAMVIRHFLVRLNTPYHFASDVTERGYVTPSESSFNLVDSAISEAIGELMTGCSFDEVVAELKGIAAAIRANNCCNGGQSTPQSYTEWGTPVLGNETGKGIDDIPLDRWPDGVLDSDWRAHRCLTANYVVSGLIASINNMALVGLSQLVLGGVGIGIIAVFAGFAVLGPVGLAVFAGAMVAAGLTTAALYGFADMIEGSRADLVCAIVTSDTALAAYSKFAALIRDMEWQGVDLFLVEELIMSLVPIDVFNRVYDGLGLPPVFTEAPYDCTECEGEEGYYDFGIQDYDFDPNATLGGFAYSAELGAFAGSTYAAGSVWITHPSSRPDGWLELDVDFSVANSSGQINVWASPTGGSYGVLQSISITQSGRQVKRFTTDLPDGYFYLVEIVSNADGAIRIYKVVENPT